MTRVVELQRKHPESQRLHRRMTRPHTTTPLAGTPRSHRYRTLLPLRAQVQSQQQLISSVRSLPTRMNGSKSRITHMTKLVTNSRRLATVTLVQLPTTPTDAHPRRLWVRIKQHLHKLRR